MNNYFHDIALYAERAFPHEICGFLHQDGQGSLKFSNVRNLVHHEAFVVSLEDVATAYSNHIMPAAFAHSHCVNEEFFSDEDVRQIERTKLPWLVYSVKSAKFNFRAPRGLYRPFEGRAFILGLQDCVSLVTDYFGKFFEISFPFFVRSWNIVAHGYALDRSMLMNAGFMITKETPTTHDVVLMRVGNHTTNHAGVIVRPGLLLHQLFGKVSSIEPYTDTTWQRLTTAVFRHPKFTSKLSVL